MLKRPNPMERWYCQTHLDHQTATNKQHYTEALFSGCLVNFFPKIAKSLVYPGFLKMDQIFLSSKGWKMAMMTLSRQSHIEALKCDHVTPSNIFLPNNLYKLLKVKKI